MHDVTIIQVNETQRVRVVYDPSPTNPRKDWDMLTGALTVNGGRNRIDVEPVHEFPGPLRDASDRLLTTERITRWARIFYDIHLDVLDGTFWWVDPTQLEANFPAVGDGTVKRFRQVEGAPINTYEDYFQSSIECQKEVILQEQVVYEQWCEGTVYGVIVEQAAPWEKTFINSGDTIEGVDWIEMEAVYGNYLDPSRDDEEQFLEIARDVYEFDETEDK